MKRRVFWRKVYRARIWALVPLLLAIPAFAITIYYSPPDMPAPVDDGKGVPVESTDSGGGLGSSMFMAWLAVSIACAIAAAVLGPKCPACRQPLWLAGASAVGASGKCDGCGERILEDGTSSEDDVQITDPPPPVSP